MFPDADIPGLDTTVREVMQRAFCTATCPSSFGCPRWFLDIGTDGALEFERECNALLTQGISIFGFPVISGLGEIGLPGTGSGGIHVSVIEDNAHRFSLLWLQCV